MGIFAKRKEAFDGGGLILFRTTKDAMKAQKALKEAGFVIKLVAPPVSKRKGCDLAIEFNSVERLAVERELKRGKIPHEGFDILEDGALRPVDVVKTVEFGDFIMVKAANMKLTFSRKNNEIKNISGGGCPDVPYLYEKLVGKNIFEAIRPRESGSTLCALMLDLAFEKALEIAKGW